MYSSLETPDAHLSLLSHLSCLHSCSVYLFTLFISSLLCALLCLLCLSLHSSVYLLFDSHSSYSHILFSLPFPHFFFIFSSFHFLAEIQLLFSCPLLLLSPFFLLFCFLCSFSFLPSHFFLFSSFYIFFYCGLAVFFRFTSSLHFFSVYLYIVYLFLLTISSLFFSYLHIIPFLLTFFIFFLFFFCLRFSCIFQSLLLLLFISYLCLFMYSLSVSSHMFFSYFALSCLH